MLTFTEITVGFTRSTMSPKPAGLALLVSACAGLDKKKDVVPVDGPKP